MLKGIDQNINIILDDSKERIFSTIDGTKTDVVGGCLIRGDDM